MKNGHGDLSSCTLDSVANAVDAFEEEKGLVLCHLRPSAFSKLVPFFSVPQGYYALVQRGGKFADYGESGTPVWPAGLHFGALKRVSERVRLKTGYNLLIRSFTGGGGVLTDII